MPSPQQARGYYGISPFGGRPPRQVRPKQRGIVPGEIKIWYILGASVNDRIETSGSSEERLREQIRGVRRIADRLEAVRKEESDLESQLEALCVEASETLYKIHYAKLLELAKKDLPNDEIAEEVVGQTFEAAAKNLITFEGLSSTWRWLYTGIFRRKRADFFRNQDRQRHDDVIIDFDILDEIDPIALKAFHSLDYKRQLTLKLSYDAELKMLTRHMKSKILFIKESSLPNTAKRAFKLWARRRESLEGNE